MLPVTVSGSASGTAQLIVKPGTANPADKLTLSDSGSGTRNRIGVRDGGPKRPAIYPGGSTSGAQKGSSPGPTPPAGSPQQGSDGTWDPAGDAAGVTAAIIGDENAKTGMYALLDVDLFNILCIPATMNLGDDDAEAVAAAAIALCTKRRAIYLIDPPSAAASATP